MSFPQQKRVAELGTKQALNRSLLFDEREVLEAASSYLRRTLNFGQIHFQSAEEAVANSAELEGKEGFTKEMAESAEPGSRKYRGEK